MEAQKLESFLEKSKLLLTGTSLSGTPHRTYGSVHGGSAGALLKFMSGIKV